jgi:hypothetical protein
MSGPETTEQRIAGYRKEARRARADAGKYPAAREQFMKIARTWEDLANQIERDLRRQRR